MLLSRRPGLKLVALAALFLTTYSYSQEVSNRGASEFSEYDKSHISPELRRKHAITLGAQNAFSTPWSSNFIEPATANGNSRINYNFGFHAGYNYLILNRRVRLLNPASKMITEIKNGFGIHFSMQFQKHTDDLGVESYYKEVFFNFNYYRNLFRLSIPFFQLYFINEYGLGFHYNPRFKDTETGAFSPVVSLEPLRVRLFNSQVYLHGTTYYALRNNSFDKIPLNVSFLVGARVYFYKY